MPSSPDEENLLSSGSGIAPTEAPVVAQEEDVLRDVLDELDRERTRRAELEANMRQMAEENEVLRSSYQNALSRQNDQQETIAKLRSEVAAFAKTETNENKEVTNRAFMAMETQVREFQALIDELTKGKPAIAAAADGSVTPAETNTTRTPSKRPTARQHPKASTLPLYVVRLLEILPWTPHAQQHVFFREEIFEWQFYDVREKQWISNVRCFPQFFKSLPIVRPKVGKGVIGDNTKDKDRGLLLFLAGGSGKNNPAAPSKHGVLTDEQMTQLLSIEEGFPLPEDGGTWEWIGGWSIEKRVSSQSSSLKSIKQRVDCDEYGWSYAQEAQFFKENPTEWVWDNPGDDQPNMGGFPRKLRRRKWTRRRVLVDYPYASEQTKEYLKLLAENARLTFTSNKISDQLVETKTALTDNEEVLMKEKSEAAAEAKKLREELQIKDEMLREAGMEVAPRSRSGSSGNPLQEFMAKHEQVKGFGSKISQWVKSGRIGESNAYSTHGTSNNDTLASVPPIVDDHQQAESTDGTSVSPKQSGGFDWKKMGRAAFFDKLKGNQSHSERSNDGRAEGTLDKLGESANKAARNSSEGSSTDESVEDVMEMQEAA